MKSWNQGTHEVTSPDWIAGCLHTSNILCSVSIKTLFRLLQLRRVSSPYKKLNCCWDSAACEPLITAIKIQNTHTYSYTHTQLFYVSLDFVQTTRVSRYQKNIHPLIPIQILLLNWTELNLSWPSIILYLFLPSAMIQGILPVQFNCLTVFFHNLAPSFLWSTSWPGTLHFILHTFLNPIIVFFSQQMPIPS